MKPADTHNTHKHIQHTETHTTQKQTHINTHNTRTHTHHKIKQDNSRRKSPNLDTSGAVGLSGTVGFHINLDHIAAESRSHPLHSDPVQEVGLTKSGRWPTDDSRIPRGRGRHIERSLGDICGGEGEGGSWPRPYTVEHAQQHGLGGVEGKVPELILEESAFDVHCCCT